VEGQSVVNYTKLEGNLMYCFGSLTHKLGKLVSTSFWICTES
jgi:hypothetical protein